MTFLHHSTLAMRRLLVRRSRPISKRTYTQMSTPVMKVSQQEANVVSRGNSRSSGSDGWILPLAIAMLGLTCSTISTHQLMSCANANRLKALQDKE